MEPANLRELLFYTIGNYPGGISSVISTPILGTVLANKFAAQMKINLPATLQQAMNNLPPAVQQVLSDSQSLTNAQTQAAIKSKFDVFGANGVQLYHQFISIIKQLS